MPDPYDQYNNPAQGANPYGAAQYYQTQKNQAANNPAAPGNTVTDPSAPNFTGTPNGQTSTPNPNTQYQQEHDQFRQHAADGSVIGDAFGFEGTNPYTSGGDCMNIPDAQARAACLEGLQRNRQTHETNVRQSNNANRNQAIASGQIPDMSGYQGEDGKRRWMQESGGTEADYNRQMALWRGEVTSSPTGQPQPGPGGNQGVNTQNPPAGAMDYNTWLQAAREEAQRRGEPFQEAGAQDQYEAYLYNHQYGAGGVNATQQQSGTSWGSGYSAAGAADATGMRQRAREMGFSEDFDRFDEGTLMSWEKYKDERCPPGIPYRAIDGSGCVEKPIDSAESAGQAQYIGAPWPPAGSGGAGGGGGGGGGGGRGGGGAGGYGLQGGWDQGLTQMYKDAMSGKDSGQLFEMMGGGAAYSEAMDNVRAQIAMMEEGPAKDAAKRRLAEMEATGEMQIGAAAKMQGLQGLQGLIPLHQDAWKFSNQLRENARQFNQSLAWDKDKFGQTMAWGRESFYAGLDWEKDRFAQDLAFREWATQGSWDNAVQLAQMQIDANKKGFWSGWGSLLGGVGSSFFGGGFASLFNRGNNNNNGGNNFTYDEPSTFNWDAGTDYASSYEY